MRRLSTLALVAALAGCTPDTPTAPDAYQSEALLARGGGGGMTASMNQMLASARAATARFHRVEVAEAAGYVNTGECVAIPSGAMGIHFVNPALMQDASYDPSRPEVLVYEPQKNGKLRLVAVEWLIFAEPWTAAGHDKEETPMFGSVPFFKSFGPAAHGLPDHYELHAWVWKSNPDGIFAQWNPNVSCEYAAH